MQYYVQEGSLDLEVDPAGSDDCSIAMMSTKARITHFKLLPPLMLKF